MPIKTVTLCQLICVVLTCILSNRVSYDSIIIGKLSNQRVCKCKIITATKVDSIYIHCTFMLYKL